jgi:hypothetical protein
MGINEPHVDANPLAQLQDGALHHPCGLQLARDLRHRLDRALVLHHGRAGDDAQTPGAAELGDDGVGHGIGEGFLAPIGREVLERQDRNRPEGDRRRLRDERVLRRSRI